MHPGKDFVYAGESRLSSAQIDGESGCGSGLNVTCAITADRIPINDNITIEVSSPLICAARASTMAGKENHDRRDNTNELDLFKDPRSKPVGFGTQRDHKCQCHDDSRDDPSDERGFENRVGHKG